MTTINDETNKRKNNVSEGRLFGENSSIKRHQVQGGPPSERECVSHTISMGRLTETIFGTTGNRRRFQVSLT